MMEWIGHQAVPTLKHRVRAGLEWNVKVRGPARRKLTREPVDQNQRKHPSNARLPCETTEAGAGLRVDRHARRPVRRDGERGQQSEHDEGPKMDTEKNPGPDHQRRACHGYGDDARAEPLAYTGDPGTSEPGNRPDGCGERQRCEECHHGASVVRMSGRRILTCLRAGHPSVRGASNDGRPEPEAVPSRR